MIEQKIVITTTDLIAEHDYKRGVDVAIAKLNSEGWYITQAHVFEAEDYWTYHLLCERTKPTPSMGPR